MDRIIHCKATLNCSPRQAFDLFTENRLVQGWLAESADIEPREGGKYELFWDESNKRINSSIGCKVTLALPGRLLCFEWKGPEQFAHFMNTADPLTHVSVFFSPAADGGGTTDVYLVHIGWRSGGDWELARQWFERVWQNALAALEKQVTV